MTYRTVRLCASRGSFEAIPEPPAPLDLRRLRTDLEAQGVAVVDARVMLIARLSKEVTFGRDGRVLIKSRDPVEAQRLLDELRPLLERPPAEPV